MEGNNEENKVDKQIRNTKIDVDPEFLEILDRLESKVRHATWDGIGKISKPTLTRILAKKIKSSKIV